MQNIKNIISKNLLTTVFKVRCDYMNGSFY
jgi:hypothetical protein